MTATINKNTVVCLLDVDGVYDGALVTNMKTLLCILLYIVWLGMCLYVRIQSVRPQLGTYVCIVMFVSCKS